MSHVLHATELIAGPNDCQAEPSSTVSRVTAFGSSRAVPSNVTPLNIQTIITIGSSESVVQRQFINNTLGTKTTHPQVPDFRDVFDILPHREEMIIDSPVVFVTI